jgi:uncharacterized membrane protein
MPAGLRRRDPAAPAGGQGSETVLRPGHPPARRSWSHALAVPRAPGGHLGGALAFAAALTPGLYPRHWLVQGALCGVALAAGYGLAVAARAAVRGAPPRPEPRPALRLFSLCAVAVAVAGLVWNAGWQADVRSLMGIAGGGVRYLAAVSAVALLVGYLLVLLAHAAQAGHRAYVRVLWRVVPAHRMHRTRVGIALLVLVFFVSGLPLGWTLAALDGALVRGDARVAPDVPQPTTTYRSGGPDSLIPWSTMSAPGRRFVAQGPTVADLEAFGGAAVAAPIRVYVGMDSERTDRERARLAVAELDRTGAFERAVLVVVTPTGSGSINPYAIDPLEYMYRGDTAAVALQYGHLPSWVTMFGNQERAQRGARALFDAVHRRLAEQPPDARPTLLVYGESLGSFGSESLFAGLDDIRAGTDGVLWVGPTRGNRLWRRFTDERDAGSPIWQPVHDGGRGVRFGRDAASLLEPGGDWPFPRVAYLQHATDPITWHNPRVLLDRPAWLDPPRGPDISDALPYIPLLTGWQLTIDMALAETAPLGHGHLYGPEQAGAWALIAAPPGWTPQQTRDLEALLAAS